MTKKRISFGISKELDKGLTETFNTVESNRGALRYETIPLYRIELDADNPRNLAITLEDIEKGLKNDDPFLEIKRKELESLTQLGDTIKKKGLLNAVLVYRGTEKYRLVAGERRYLASVLIGKDDIQVKIFDKKPAEEDLRIIQWIENTEREDLSLKERIENINAVISAYQKNHPGITVDSTLIKELFSFSKSHAWEYLTILKAPKDVKQLIDEGKISNIEKAVLLSKIEDDSARTKMIQEMLSGVTVKDLKTIVKTSNGIRNKNPFQINLGQTSQANVVKTIIECVLENDKFRKYSDDFKDFRWDNVLHTKRAFKLIVELLEKETSRG